jgi:hypothetical protein
MVAEGARPRYLLDLIEISGDAVFYRDVLHVKLGETSDEDPDLANCADELVRFDGIDVLQKRNGKQFLPAPRYLRS